MKKWKEVEWRKEDERVHDKGIWFQIMNSECTCISWTIQSGDLRFLRGQSFVHYIVYTVKWNYGKTLESVSCEDAIYCARSLLIIHFPFEDLL